MLINKYEFTSVTDKNKQVVLLPPENHFNVSIEFPRSKSRGPHHHNHHIPEEIKPSFDINLDIGLSVFLGRLMHRGYKHSSPTCMIPEKARIMTVHPPA